MHKNLIGQTEKQKRNCEEQQNRRADIKKKFPKTITFYTYERTVQKVEKRIAKLAAIYEKLDIKLRKSELKSLAITSYIDMSNSTDKFELLRFIHDQLVENNVSIKKLTLRLNRKFPEKGEWNRERLEDFVLFKD
ncbi:hypothetical protein B0186_06060 [Canicola haemoglobinophilus]|uniref:Uncharacterized protein n=1 Tax=Canicola haemoglobinophilus TaxID=733 RepID=A0A1V4B0Y8_9PAST|nr:hypothetical protein [Canicola haemoglobinophilus]OOS00405.1 hypothetical protein B0186_06060 [Canicola haemoglobinophilus]STO59438.1 Uncharacterised protein [Canicola haemoglobinophilus]